ncbi:LLM class flavin-dependent oxidoreductase [Mycobacterium sp. CVI_P3]|uniref:LLM class flavin-dependent oxidoreductase n=1 Tax=Mycobacterium pinniadriaticum TaxID=2994102 RepID=A0ABT3SNF4_9MYCO|nr:LLM class flavin-dependent oxidoreductase [Mycobacterium pinniadriaticum]MCX2934565.1 LLM class flavin-dependent oxidoreductase [Mycobacterium pinniadriaticum]MCX2940988.1 LLM class flavin-dependent oxidoreductase [Mycobacterium pinniadriaticum]
MSLKFGVLWPFRNPGPERIPWDEFYQSHLDLIADSELMGFDNAWLTEHHFVDDGYSPSLLPIGAAVAARTKHIRIGTFLLLLPLHNPVRVAEDTATVDLISEGRFDLGVGLGYRAAEFDDQGIPVRERAGRMQEGLTLVRQLLAGEAVTFEGRYNSLRDIRISPPALQQPHPPIWVGGSAPKAIERAARMGFHFLSGGPGSVEVYDNALRDCGRDPADFNVAATIPTYVAPTREQAWEIAAESLHYMASGYVEWTSQANNAGEADLAALPSVDDIVAGQSMDFFGEPALVGSPKDVIEQIEEYRSRSRLTHLVCAMALPGMPVEQIRSGMELFAHEVIPAFRQA